MVGAARHHLKTYYPPLMSHWSGAAPETPLIFPPRPRGCYGPTLPSTRIIPHRYLQCNHLWRVPPSHSSERRTLRCKSAFFGCAWPEPQAVITLMQQRHPTKDPPPGDRKKSPRLQESEGSTDLRIIRWPASQPDTSRPLFQSAITHDTSDATGRIWRHSWYIRGR